MRVGSANRTGGSVVALLLGVILAIGAVSAAAAGGQSDLARVRAVTAGYHDLAVAESDGYGVFYVCTDEPGEGAMGQHFVNLALVLDATIDPLQPEALAYEPQSDGGYRLVAAEYLVFAEAWDADHEGPPSQFGQQFGLVGASNRYGLHRSTSFTPGSGSRIRPACSTSGIPGCIARPEGTSTSSPCHAEEAVAPRTVHRFGWSWYRIPVPSESSHVSQPRSPSTKGL